MTIAKKELGEGLKVIEKKLNVLIKDFADIKKNISAIKKHLRIKRDTKEITDLKNTIAS